MGTKTKSRGGNRKVTKMDDLGLLADDRWRPGLLRLAGFQVTREKHGRIVRKAVSIIS